MEPVSERGTGRLTVRYSIRPVITLVTTSHKCDSPVRLRRFLSGRPCFSSTCRLHSVVRTTSVIGVTVTRNGGVTICNSCSYSNIATATVLCECLGNENTSYLCCVPSHFTRNCNVGYSTIGGLFGRNARLVVAISGKVSYFSRVALTGRLNVAIIMASRRVPPRGLPPTTTIMSPGHVSYPSDFGSVYNTRMTFGLVYIVRNTRPRRLLTSCTSVLSITIVTSVVPLALRGHVVIGCNVRTFGESDYLIKLHTLLGITNMGVGRVDTSHVTFNVYPHVGTTNEVKGTKETIRLLVASSVVGTLRVSGRVSTRGSLHRRARGGVYSRTIGLVRVGNCGCSHMVIISNSY